MINIITGKPGTGKTYYLCKLAFQFIEEGRDVYSNFFIDLNLEKTLLLKVERLKQEIEKIESTSFENPKTKKIEFLKAPKWQSKDLKKLEKLYKKCVKANIRKAKITKIKKKLGFNFPPKGNVFYWSQLDELIGVKGGEIFIDECQIYFNSRDWKNLPKELQYKFQQHRKHIKRDEKGKVIGLNIWGAVQNVKRIDTVVRELVNNIFILKKIGFFFLARQYDIEDLDKENKTCYSRKFFCFSNILANSYDTFQEIRGFTKKEQKN